MLFWRSRRVSSEVVFDPRVARLGATTAALRWDGIADFGVKGFIEALRGSGPDLDEDEAGFEL